MKAWLLSQSDSKKLKPKLIRGGAHMLLRMHGHQARESKVSEFNCNEHGEFEKEAQEAASYGWGRIHKSHRRYILKDLVFCAKCGFWSSTRVSSKLQAACSGFCPTGTAHRLKRMRGGMHPLRSMQFWPDGTSTDCKSVVRALDL